VTVCRGEWVAGSGGRLRVVEWVRTDTPPEVIYDDDTVHRHEDDPLTPCAR
jgi:hypothetical protein